MTAIVTLSGVFNKQMAECSLPVK